MAEEIKKDQGAEPETKLIQVVHRAARISWPEFTCDYGTLKAGSWDIDPRITARVDIWACSKSAANPDGYFISLADPNKPYLGAEPGDPSNEKHLICKIIFNGTSGLTSKVTPDNVSRNGNRSYHIEYLNPRFKDQLVMADLLPASEVIPDDVVIAEPLVIGQEIPKSPAKVAELSIPSKSVDKEQK